MDHDRRTGHARTTSGAAATRHELAPGKRTLTAQLPVQRRESASSTGPDAAASAASPPRSAARSTLQRLFGNRPAPLEAPAQLHAAEHEHGAAPGPATGGPEPEAAAIQASARRGIATPSSPLPHVEQLQRLFGRHDLSGIKAHTGPEAAASAEAMGAQAYATGDHVVLGPGADLHTVAHEAAHAIQQRAGVHLSGGVGRAGDPHERHADAVADRVVQGRSSEDLLDAYAGSRPGGGGDHAAAQPEPAGPVQRKVTVGGAAYNQDHQRIIDSLAGRRIEGVFYGLTGAGHQLLAVMKLDAEIYPFTDMADLIQTLNDLGERVGPGGLKFLGGLSLEQLHQYKQFMTHHRAARGLSAGLLAQLGECLAFVRDEARGDALSSLRKLTSVPASLDELDLFSKVANELYARFDHKINQAGMAAYRSNLNGWAARLQSAIYDLRDALLIEHPQEVRRYGLVAQHEAMFPGQQVPAVLTGIDQTLGVIVFSTDVQNDCGRFANLLLEHRKRDLVNQFIAARGLDQSREFPPEQRHELLTSPETTAVKTAKLDYHEDDSFPYPHHAKTSLGAVDEHIYTLEAHKGKPFLLAPELRRYDSHAAFLEDSDPHIKAHTESTLSGKLERELTSLAVDRSPAERYQELRVAGGSTDHTTKPIGRRPDGGMGASSSVMEPLARQDHQVENEEAPVTAIELLSRERLPDVARYLRELVGVPVECMDATMGKLEQRLHGDRPSSFLVSGIVKEFSTGFAAGNYKFNQDKWHSWMTT